MPSYRRDYGPQGCAEQGVRLLWALTLIAGLLGALPRRPQTRKDTAR